MTFKEAWLNDEDKDLVGSPVDAYIWVEICQRKKLILKGRRQEHEIDPAKFPRNEVEAHEQVLLQLIGLSLAKCDLLGLQDQIKILIKISDECGFIEEQALEGDVEDEGHPQEIHKEAFQENDPSLEMTLQIDERPCDEKN